MAEYIGFKFVETIDMKIQSRSGVGHADNSIRKQEGIFVFKK